MDMPQRLHERFDIALVTIGVLGWMPDVTVLQQSIVYEGQGDIV